MKTLIILAVFSMQTGGYKYACADELNHTECMTMADQLNVGDTIFVDSMRYVVDVRHKR